MLFSSVISVFAISDGDTIRFTSRVEGSNTGIRTFSSGDYEGCCSQMGNPGASSGTAKATELSDNSKTAMIAYYYGYEKGYASKDEVYPGDRKSVV